MVEVTGFEISTTPQIPENSSKRSEEYQGILPLSCNGNQYQTTGIVVIIVVIVVKNP